MEKQEQTEFLIANIIDKLTQYLMEDFHVDIVTAMNIIYNAELYNLLQDAETGLYSQSPLYVYEYLKDEYLMGKAL